jgi:hypothetical protein
MCGCLVALVAFFSPRLAIFLVWLFTDRMGIAFNSFWIALLGFLFLPWTTLAWAVAYAPIQGVTGFGWFVVILAFFADLSTHYASFQARQQRRAAAA